MYRLLVVCLLASTASHAFSVLSCKKVISDEFEMTVRKRNVHVKWVTRGGAGPVALLRTLADPKIPTSLLAAYGDIRVEFTLPIDACEFDDDKAGHFACEIDADDSASIDFRIQARVSPYGKEEFDEYDGALSEVSVSSLFFGKKGSRYLKFPMKFKVSAPKRKTVNTETNFFFAHHWTSEGFGQNPDCQVDNVYLVD